ncbi:helix-turn-helix domain-containing protein [Catenulispora sp. MAP12-49]|uniref:helix-turn-helix domain-containing protein n=1 Tax=Catenulispora sp. MAP12-49 TaxID=3156302 RepID=UPI0035171B37
MGEVSGSDENLSLRIDGWSQWTYSRLIDGLRTARGGRSQNQVAIGLPVRGRAISEWETETYVPTLENLILWAGRVERRLVIEDRRGELQSLVRPRAGESWVLFERRRLAYPLRRRRDDLGLSISELCRRVGVSRDSVSRWELAYTPPRPIALVVWAQVLGCSLGLREIAERENPVSTSDGRQSRDAVADARRSAEGMRSAERA